MRPRMQDLLKSGDTPYAKHMWTELAETSCVLAPEVLNVQLATYRKALTDGLSYYKRPDEKSDKILAYRFSGNLYVFVLRIRKHLELNALQAFDLLCHYLVEEFKGSHFQLEKILEHDPKIHLLLTDIWEFYNSERLFLLKSINLLLNPITTDPVKKAIFDRFVTDTPGEKFLESLILQLETHVMDNVSMQIVNKQLELKWHEYHLREQIELLHCLILYIDRWGCNLLQLERLLRVTSFHKVETSITACRMETAKIHEYRELIRYLQTVVVLVSMNLGKKSNCISWSSLVDASHILDKFEPKNSPVVFAFILMEVLTSPADGNWNKHYKLGELALAPGVFNYMVKILKCAMMKDFKQTVSEITYLTIYELAHLLVQNFPWSALTQIPGLKYVTAQLFNHPIISREVWATKTIPGPRTLFLLLIEQFSEDYVPFYDATRGLLLYAKRHLQEVNLLMTNFKEFALYWDPNVQLSTSITSKEDDVTFNVFNIIYKEIHKMRPLLFTGQPIDKTIMKRIITILKFFLDWLSVDIDAISNEESSVVEQVFTLIRSLRSEDDASTKLFALCLNIATTTMHSPELKPNIFSYVRSLNILPSMKTLPNKFLHLEYEKDFCSNAIGTKLDKVEKPNGRYYTLKCYLNLLLDLIQSKLPVEHAVQEHQEVIVPGVVFVISKVFPCYQSWIYRKIKDFDIIGMTCVSIFHEILTLKYIHEGIPKHVTPLFAAQKIIMTHFTCSTTGRQLIEIISAGEAAIQSSMEREIHWFSEITGKFTLFVHIAMSILQRVLHLFPIVEGDPRLEDTSLALVIFHPPDISGSMNVLPALIGYLNTTFCRRLPFISLAILIQLAQILPNALMSSIGLEPKIIGNVIRRKLSSKFENVTIKESLLKFISQCCENQPALCNAIFDVEEKKPDKPGFRCYVHGGCLRYMLQILDEVKEGKRDVTDQLYSSTVECFLAIWTGSSDDVLDYLRKSTIFWKSFCAPLKNFPSSWFPAQVHIFTVIAIEIFCLKDQCNAELQNIVKNMFDDKTGTILKWFELIATIVKKESMKNIPLYECVDVPADILLSEAVKRFLICAVTYLNCEICKESIALIYECLTSSMRENLFTVDRQSLGELSEIYVFMDINVSKMCQWISPSNVKVIVELIAEFPNSIGYQNLDPEARVAFLSVLVKEADGLQDSLTRNADIAETVALSALKILLLELENLQRYKLPVKKMNTSQTKPKKVLTVITGSQGEGLTMFQNQFTCMGMKKIQSCRLALFLLQKLLKAIGCFISNRQNKFAKDLSKLILAFEAVMSLSYDKEKHTLYMGIAEHMVKILLLFLRNGLMRESFLSLMKIHIWLPLVPPCRVKRTEWLEAEWVALFKPVFDMMSLYILKMGTDFVMKHAVAFVSIHSDYIEAVITGIYHSLRPDLLRLCISALHLMKPVSAYAAERRLENKPSIASVRSATIYCLTAAVGLAISPPLLKLYLDELAVKTKQKPSLEVSSNLILELTCMCLSVVRTISPRLFKLIQTKKPAQKWPPIVEIDFSGPLFDLSEQNLTFGTLIALNMFCSNTVAKCSRVSSPGVLIRTVRSKISSSSFSLVLDKKLTLMAFEMSFELIISQAILHLSKLKLSYIEKRSFQKVLSVEMEYLWAYAERVHYQMTEFCYSEDFYLTKQKYLPFLLHQKNGTHEETKKSPYSPRKVNGDLSPNLSYSGTSRTDVEMDKDQEFETLVLVYCKFFTRFVLMKVYRGNTL